MDFLGLYSVDSCCNLTTVLSVIIAVSASHLLGATLIKVALNKNCYLTENIMF